MKSDREGTEGYGPTFVTEQKGGFENLRDCSFLTISTAVPEILFRLGLKFKLGESDLLHGGAGSVQIGSELRHQIVNDLVANIVGYEMRDFDERSFAVEKVKEGFAGEGNGRGSFPLRRGWRRTGFGGRHWSRAEEKKVVDR